MRHYIFNPKKCKIINMPDDSVQSSALFEEINQLKEKIASASIPAGLEEKVSQMLTRLNRMAKFGGYANEYEKISHYISWITCLPWQKKARTFSTLIEPRKLWIKTIME